MEPTHYTVASKGLSRRTFLGAGLAAGGLWLAGCGGDDDDATDGTAAPGTAAPGTAAPGTSTAGTTGDAGGPPQTEELRIGVPTDIQPAGMLRFTPGNRPVRRTIYDVVVDRAQDGTYLPSLASEWAWDAAATTLVITLRDDVTFHSGRPFTADDVVFLVEQAVAEGSGAQVAALLRRGDLQKTGDHELTVTFEAPFASYLDAFAALPVVDSETWAEIESGEQLVGTGPFTWQGWTPGSGFEMQRNESYWGDAVAFGQLSVRVIPEPQAALAAMRSGDLDLYTGMIARDAASLAESGFQLFPSPGFDYYVGINTTVAPFDDVRVRQAVAYALDRDRIVDQVFSGLAEATSIPWSSDTPGVTPEMVNRYSYDLEKAKALIAEAGAEGAEVLITPSPQLPSYGAVAEIAQFGLTEIGLKPRMVTVDPAEFPAKMQAGDFPGLWVAIVGLTTLGPTTSLLTANPFKAEENTHHHTPPEYQALVAGVVDAPSDEDLASAVGDLTEHMLENAFHNSVVQASDLAVSVEGMEGVAYDASLSLVLTKAALTT